MTRMAPATRNLFVWVVVFLCLLVALAVRWPANRPRRHRRSGDRRNRRDSARRHGHGDEPCTPGPTGQHVTDARGRISPDAPADRQL